MKVISDGTTFFENTPTVLMDTLGNIIIMDDIVYPINGMDKTDCISMYVVLNNRIMSPEVVYFLISNPGETFTIPSLDGYLSFCHIVLPNRQFFDDHSGEFHYWASEEGKIYNRNSEEVPILEVIEVNDDTIIKHIHNFFSVFHLRECYISLCQKVFKDSLFDKCFSNKINTLLIYKRDLVWAALNVIQYMIDFNLLAEALRLLERINGCNGLCSSKDTRDTNCGCEQ